MLSFWKKKKVLEKKEPRGKIHKISRLVSDLNSKRESLVQTGFPTSVADLVVNSRINWIPPVNERRPSKKTSKPSIKDICPPFLNQSTIHIPTPVVQHEPTNHSHLESGPVLQQQIQKQLINKAPSQSGETEEDPLLLKNIKVVSLLSLLSVLAFVTKEVTLGITILAFCFLLAEYVQNSFSHPSKLSTCSAGVLNTKGEGSSHWSITAFEEVGARHVKTGFTETKGDERMSLIHDEEIQAHNSPSDSSSMNEGRHFQESRRDEQMAVKQDSVVSMEAVPGNKTWKVKLKIDIKTKVVKRLFSKTSRSSKNGNVEKISPEADGLPGSEIVQETDIVKKEKLYSEEQGLLSPSENGLPLITEKSGIKGNLCIVHNLSLENMIFVGVILSGLVGGRLVALVITTSWYLLVKCRQQRAMAKQE